MSIIACFLTDDVGSDIVGWKKWLDDEKSEYTSSNASLLEKEDNKVIIVHLWFGENYEGEDEVELTKRQFIYLLDRWDKFRNKKSEEIIITLENGKLLVEGKD